MQGMGVDVVGLVDYSDILFRDNSSLDFADFIRLVIQLRGNNSATVRDIVDLRKFFMQELQDLQENLLQLVTELMDPGRPNDDRHDLDKECISSSISNTSTHRISRMLVSNST